MVPRLYYLLCMTVPVFTFAASGDSPVIVKAKRKPDQRWKDYPTRTIGSLKGYSSGEVPLNRYGSRMDQGREKATGFFYCRKIGRRWWLIDPEGYRHINIAVVSVRRGRGRTQVQAFAQKYPSPQAWADATTALLKAYGFNGTGAWSDDRTLGQAKHRLSYCVNWKFMGTFARGRAKQASGHLAYPGNCIFVFDPDWPSFCERHAREHIAPVKNDPYLLGHFFDNELPLKPGMLRRYLKLPANSHGYQAAKRYVDERRKQGKSEQEILKHDWQAFDDLVMEKYMGTIARAIRKVDPNHMLLGPRLYSRNASYPVIGRYVDAFAYNLYGVWSPREKAVRLANAVGKPLIVTEFYTKGMDVPGLTNETGAGWCVPTQKDRGLFYQNFCLDLLESGICVGWQWFKYQDNDPTDTKADPSNRNSNKGILNSAYEPYLPLLEKMKALNEQVYSLIDYFDNIHSSTRE
ncbi:MAG: agarase [Lentisphaerae bacterium]|nr:MAG: agarase [Lentisphaerota bacterium]